VFLDAKVLRNDGACLGPAVTANALRHR